MGYVEKSFTFQYKGFTTAIEPMPGYGQYTGRTSTGGVLTYFNGRDPDEMRAQFERIIDDYLIDLAALTK